MLADFAAQRTAFEQSRETALDSAACLIAAFRVLGVPKGILDVGCGEGHLVRVAAALGATPAIGCDLHVDRDWGDGWHVFPFNLELPLVAESRPMVLCLEVAEHLPPESADALCDTLAKVTGETLLFSAATPGQGGSGHLNEQPHDYWRRKLEDRGLQWDVALTDTLRTDWSKVAPRAWWYGQNIQVFRQTDKARKDGA